MTRLLVAFTLGLISLVVVPGAHAQYPGYRPGYPGNPYAYGNPYAGVGRGYNYGAAAQGQASLVQASSQVTLDNENARILREQANQAKLDTKRKAFDEMRYEKANTPSYTEVLGEEKARRLQRMMNYPTRPEITEGKTLNEMLPFLQDLSYHGAQGPPVILTQSIVNQLNIAGTSSASVGMLKAGGHVEWPIGLRGPQQKKLDMLLPQAYDATRDGTLDTKLMKQVRTEIKTMRETLRTQLQKDEIDGSSYVVALEFWMSLDSSVSALEKPDAKKQLSGAMSPRARNVQELVDFMADNGYRFGPAMPGQESAYQVTHDSFVRYVRTAQSSGGLQALNSPTMPAGKKK